MTTPASAAKYEAPTMIASESVAGFVGPFRQVERVALNALDRGAYTNLPSQRVEGNALHRQVTGLSEPGYTHRRADLAMRFLHDRPPLLAVGGARAER